MLTKQQQYSIASTLATSSTATVKTKLAGNSEAISFIEKIEKYFVKKDGFIPKQVLKIINL
jgi:hypothetical protein